MTKRVTQVAAVIAAIVLGGPLLVLRAKQNSANPAARTKNVCATQNMGQHMGMGRMMANHHMNTRAMTGTTSGAGAEHCHGATGINSPTLPGRDGQAGSSPSAPSGRQQ